MNLSYLLIIFRTMQNMKMHLRTSFGVSTSFYTSDAQTFQESLQGSLQDNGAAPVLWLIISIF